VTARQATGVGILEGVVALLEGVVALLELGHGGAVGPLYMRHERDPAHHARDLVLMPMRLLRTHR
jgi:hypothetical protein